ncbi:MAG: AAA family ATPase [Burkholderiales bacterium]|nr:AAA family ATPase [Burkholderiales bacterium]
MARKATRGTAGRRVEIRLLGGFAASVDGARIPPGDWPGRRAAELVQLLGLADRHRLLREQIIDALWPQLAPEAGGANLRKAAHYARQALRSPDAVVLRGGQVILCPSAALDVDALRFEREAGAALASGDPAACAAAAEGYAGELLPGASYEPWTEAARERLRSRYVALLRASEQWERLAEAEPTDEPAHRALMQRELAAGNRAAAIRWYARLRTALQHALGVAPDRETEALYAQCIAGAERPGPAFVGRQSEFARVTAWLRASPAERAGGLLVRGAAGIGKTAFCRQIEALARERGWKVVSVDAAQPGRAYAAVAAVVDQMILQNRAVMEPIGAPARAVLAALTALAGAAPAAAGPLGRHQVIGALRRLLLAASEGGPVMVLVDDAHLLDEADADVMVHLAATGRPVCVALALRAPPAVSPLAERVSRLAHGRQLETIALGPLSDEAAAALAAHAAPRALDPSLRARIVALAEGNAFAVLELARSIGPGADTRLPPSVREAVTTRLCNVDAGALALLKRLALASDELDPALVIALSQGTEAAAFALLDLALDAGVLVVADGRYRFRHELVRQALVEQIPPHQRLKAHRDAARRLAQLAVPPAVVARHWLAGGSPAEAAAWLLDAARDAMRLGAFQDALRQLEPLLDYARDHAEALRLRAEALDALGDPAALAAYDRAADAAGEPASHDLRAKRALAQIKLGDPKGALRALDGVRPTTVDGRLAEALAYSGAAALGVADPAMGTLKSAEARRLALQTGDKAAIVVASWAQAAAAHARGELHSSVWADLHETHHVPHLAVRVFDGQLCITQRFLYGARPYPEVIAFADALAAEAKRLGAARGHAFGVTLRGEAELLAGDLDAAEEHLVLGGRLHRAFGGATGEALALQRRAEAALYRGRRDAAAALLDEALDLARQTDIGFHLLDRIYGTRVALCEAPAAALAALEEAQAAVRGPLETCPGCRITFTVPAAIAAVRAGRLDLAARLEQSVQFLAEVVMRLPAWHAALEEVRAHIARARGDDALAAARFAAAARGYRAAGQPLDAARCEALAAGAA